ncbi:cyclic nucleotide-binding domain-containing protein [Sulfurospirillum halorespirans]|uniref:Cyclic nucleotide-binding domain-containing protein n=1 Tax=Sulfurospirillum halorespirans DSM 13726 TaxID=1193502 RepID=A0A1D7TGN4_9BACT|nr:cyclic nucleotide-binding domain-containing protein [Sulfurospirillum halorespirans]AOO64161.1 hypothetical protein SHALO_0364 [Sulfurospirillum halorespirans DSM 13726]
MSKHNDFNPYLLNLNNVFCDNVYQYAYIKRYNCNETLYQQGEEPLNLYIFLSGQLKKFGKTNKIMDYTVGECIGAHANFANICYFETVKIFSPSEIFVIQFNYLQERLEQHPNILEEVVEALVKKRSIITNIIDIDNSINTL